MNRYDRRLPHCHIIGQPIFVTFRLHGSLPASRIFAPERITNSGEAFRAMDRILDRAAKGPLHLARPQIAELIEQAVQDGDCRFHRYELHAYVVMPNHVHLLVTPKVPATKWLGPLKGFTSHEANKTMATQGKPFWQDESYDHQIGRASCRERV